MAAIAAPERMRALVCDRAGLQVRPVPVPEPGAGEALIRVAACAVCQSDLHFIRDKQAGLGLGVEGGQVLGHELAGTVVAVGGGVRGLLPGTRVTARPLASCGTCTACRRGLPRACPTRSVVGFTRPGAYADYVTVPAAVVFPLPEGVSFAAAALSEPLACAYNAVLASDVAPGDWAVVVGPGPLGLLAARLLKLRGAQVLVAGTRDERLAVARRFGADAVCNVTTDELRERVLASTEGMGADAALEMVGTNLALRQALACVRLRGSVVLAGDPAVDAVLPLGTHAFLYQEQRLISSLGAGESFPRVLRLLAAGLVDTAALITHEFSLDDGAEAFRTVAERRDGALKVLVCPTGDGSGGGGGGRDGRNAAR